MSAEGNLIQYIYETLTGDMTLMALLPGGVSDDVEPRTVDGKVLFPHIIIIVNDFDDVNVIGTGAPPSRVFTNMTITVKAVSQGYSYEPCRQIMDRVDGLLAGGYNSTVMGLVRRGLVKYSEQKVTPHYKHYGFIYEAIARD